MSRPAELPTPDARYRIGQVLGEGARKRVHLARDTWLERDVALAVVELAALDAPQRARVTREARTLARLGDHPHVVTIYDILEEPGRLSLVMEHLPGGTLGERLARTPAGLPFADVWRFAGELAAALAHVHAAGVVHRDVKPANVWLTATGSVRLGDFGLARDGGSRLTAEGLIVGTVAYMAPEQAVGSGAGAPSDLYALGALLYELVTGRSPFVGDDAVAVVHQHLHAAPVAPSWLRPDVPPPLETLVLRLLAKSPDARPSAADVVAAAEKRALGPVDWTAPRNPLDRLAGGVFVGRSTELADLRAAVEEARASRGRLVLVGGEPGIGKTRLLEELATYARLRGTRVAWGRCHEEAGAPAMWPWVQIVRAVLAGRDADAVRVLLGPAASDVARLVPGVRAALPELSETGPIVSEHDRFRLFDAVGFVLRAAAAERPLVILLDDFHGADVSSLLLLGFLARELGDGRLLMVAAYRDGDVTPEHPLGALLREATRVPAVRALALGGLTGDEVARLIGHTAGLSPSPELATAVARETEGNPFFIVELVRWLAAEHRLDHPGERLGLPPTVRAVIAERLGRLAPGTRTLLRTAATVGREFTAELLAAVAHVDRHTVDAALGDAAAARVLTTVEGGRHRFGHALVRETLYAETPVAERQTVHRAVFAALRNLPDPPHAELARHAVEGGLTAEAVVQARTAGEQANAVLAFEEAARLFQVALAALGTMPTDDPSEEARLRLALAEASYMSGDFMAARAEYVRAARLALRADERRVMAHAAFGMVREHTFRIEDIDDEGIEILRAALARLESPPAPLRAAVRAALAIPLFQADMPGAQESIRRALAEARSEDPESLPEVLRMAHFILWGPDVPIADRIALTHELEEVSARHRHRLGTWTAPMVRIFDLYELGDVAAARTTAEEIARRTGERGGQPSTAWYSGWFGLVFATAEGAFADVPRLHAEAQAIIRKCAEPYRAVTELAILHAVLAQGRFADARAICERAIALLPRARFPVCALALVHAEAGDVGAVAEVLDRVARQGFESIRRDINWSGNVACLAVACARAGTRAHAAALYELFRPHAPPNVFGSLNAMGSAARYLGLLATVLDRFDEAAEHFEAAVVMNARCGARPWLAYTQHDYAEMLIRRDRPGDRERARELLAAARDGAEALGMTPLAERARTALAQTTPSAVSPPAPRRYADLKSTEELRRAELLGSAADGAAAFPELVGTSAGLREVKSLMLLAAGSPLAVLIEGETGTGKELIARGIHRAGPRGEKPFIALNCAALPEHLLESELFGHRRGSFTGAATDRVGHFEAADGGTLLLDEIGDMPAPMQAKLLRVLQEGEIVRLGESRPRRVDVRIISATNRDLAAAVAEGRFREDLFYRLCAFPIRVPPLRERGDDVATLVAHFVREAATEHGKPAPAVEPAALDRLLHAPWPGNVRALQHEIRRAVLLAPVGAALGVQHLSPRVEASVPRPPGPVEPAATLRDARDAWEARYIAETLREHGGNVSRTAAVLGLSRAMLHRKLAKYGIR